MGKESVFGKKFIFITLTIGLFLIIIDYILYSNVGILIFLKHIISIIFLMALFTFSITIKNKRSKRLVLYGSLLVFVKEITELIAHYGLGFSSQGFLLISLQMAEFLGLFMLISAFGGKK